MACAAVPGCTCAAVCVECCGLLGLATGALRAGEDTSAEAWGLSCEALPSTVASSVTVPADRVVSLADLAWQTAFGCFSLPISDSPWERSSLLRIFGVGRGADETWATRSLCW